VQLAAECEAGGGLPLDLPELKLIDGDAQLLLSTGIIPKPRSDLEARLVAAVLDGECPNVTSVRSFTAQLAVALAPGDFLARSANTFVEADLPRQKRRHDALKQLQKAGSPYAAIAERRRFKAGQQGSTFPWADTASALFERAGRCWLASEIAIIGAASSSHQLAYTKKPQYTAFGSTGHPCQLLALTRIHAADADWWCRQLEITDDELGNAEWLLAVDTVATADVAIELSDVIQSMCAGLPQSRLRAVDQAARRIRPAYRGRTDTLATAAPSVEPLHYRECKVADPEAARSPDLVDRDFTAGAPNRLWVADFTYVATWSGTVYVAFIIDVFSRRIVGWWAATQMTTEPRPRYPRARYLVPPPRGRERLVRVGPSHRRQQPRQIQRVVATP
jgi:hypothetical protein